MPAEAGPADGPPADEESGASAPTRDEPGGDSEEPRSLSVLDRALAEVRGTLTGLSVEALTAGEPATDARDVPPGDADGSAEVRGGDGDSESRFFADGDNGAVSYEGAGRSAVFGFGPVSEDLGKLEAGRGSPLLPDDDDSVRTLSQMVRLEQGSFRRRNALIAATIVAAVLAAVLLPLLLSGGTGTGPGRPARPVALGTDPTRQTPAPADASLLPPAPADASLLSPAPDAAEVEEPLPLGEEPGGTMRTDEPVELGVVDLTADEEHPEADVRSGRTPVERNGRRRARTAAGDGEPDSGVEDSPNVGSEEAASDRTPTAEMTEVPIALPEVAARRAGTEELTESRFSNLLRRSARQFVRCKPGDDTVKVTITLTVAPDGRVGNVRVTDDTPGGSGYLSRCVQRVVAAWQFPPQDRAQRLTRVMMLE